MGPPHYCPVLRLVLDMRSDESSASIEGRKVDTTIPVSNVYNIYDETVKMMEGIVEKNPSLSASFKRIRKTSSEEYYQIFLCVKLPLQAFHLRRGFDNILLTTSFECV